jgi:hypothetical protein
LHEGDVQSIDCDRFWERAATIAEEMCIVPEKKRTDSCSGIWAAAGEKRCGLVSLLGLGLVGFAVGVLAFVAGYGFGYGLGGELLMRSRLKDVGLRRGIRSGGIWHRCLPDAEGKACAQVPLARG